MHDNWARPARERAAGTVPQSPVRAIDGAARDGVRAAPAEIPAGATGVIAIDLAKVRANWRALARLVAPAQCGAVVKADAYGVGAARVIPALYAAGCRAFFVATPQEAASARPLAPDGEILVLDGLLPGTARDLMSVGALPVLASLSEVHAWAAAAENGASAPPAALHLDTGLNRLGLSASEVAELAGDRNLIGRLNLVLVMSHLACADEDSHPMNRLQLEAFNRLRALLPPAPASLAGSDGLTLGREFHFDLVRPGYALYGGQAAPGRTTPVGPVVRASARILQVRDVGAGGCIGYSASYRTQGQRRIATVAAGYADGVFRHASATNDAPGGAVAIRGKLAAIVGRVSMDLITVDVTDIDDPAPVAGDWVDLIGPGLAIEAVGAGAKTIGYEVLTRLGPRFHRLYLDQGD